MFSFFKNTGLGGRLAPGLGLLLLVFLCLPLLGISRVVAHKPAAAKPLR